MSALLILSAIALLAIAVVLAHRVRERSRRADRQSFAHDVAVVQRSSPGQRKARIREWVSPIDVTSKGEIVVYDAKVGLLVFTRETERPASAGPVNVDADGREVA